MLKRVRSSAMPQELVIYPILPVVENLRFFGELAGLARSDLAGRIEEIADALDLTDFGSACTGAVWSNQRPVEADRRYKAMRPAGHR